MALMALIVFHAENQFFTSAIKKIASWHSWF